VTYMLLASATMLLKEPIERICAGVPPPIGIPTALLLNEPFSAQYTVVEFTAMPCGFRLPVAIGVGA
jgi:hypothetical protein